MQLFSSTIQHHQFLKFDSATVGMGSVLTLICQSVSIINSQIHTHTHTRLTALCPRLPGWASTRKVKPTWILLKQETVSGSEIRWAISKSAPCSRQITTPAPHRSIFLQARCPSCRPTNSVKALKAESYKKNSQSYTTLMKFDE